MKKSTMLWYNLGVSVFLLLFSGFLFVCVKSFMTTALLFMLSILYVVISVSALIQKKRTVLFFNLAWSVLMLLGFLFLVVRTGYDKYRGVLLLVSSLFVIVSIFALMQKRWAIIISMIVAVLLFIRWTPMVEINFYMFFSGHELYQDSPATIFIVFDYFILFALPSSFMLWHYVTKMGQFFKFPQKHESNT
jgi:hypothetical protein